MSLFRRGSIWHYEFQINGKRHRGSTHTSVQTKAAQIEKRAMATVQDQGFNPFVSVKAPTLREFSTRFLKWVEEDQYLKPNSKKYYRWGWHVLSTTKLADMRLNDITRDAAAAIQISGSPSWQNQAWRTLRRMLAKAVEYKVIREAPKIHENPDESRREGHMDQATEQKLLTVAENPLRDVIVIMRDTGMRPEEVFRMRWEHVDWTTAVYFNPKGKRSKSKRHLPITSRMMDILKKRAKNGSEWVFPSKKAKCGHLTTVAKQFRQARKDAGLPDSMVLYLARHGYATDLMRETKDQFLTRDLMGHEDLQTTAIYQHPDLERARQAIENRNRRVM